MLFYDRSVLVLPFVLRYILSSRIYSLFLRMALLEFQWKTWGIYRDPIIWQESSSTLSSLLWSAAEIKAQLFQASSCFFLPVYRVPPSIFSSGVSQIFGEICMHIGGCSPLRLSVISLLVFRCSNSPNFHLLTPQANKFVVFCLSFTYPALCRLGSAFKENVV